jgi:hypothetical protein
MVRVSGATKRKNRRLARGREGRPAEAWLSPGPESPIGRCRPSAPPSCDGASGMRRESSGRTDPRRDRLPPAPSAKTAATRPDSSSTSASQAPTVVDTGLALQGSGGRTAQLDARHSNGLIDVVGSQEPVRPQHTVPDDRPDATASRRTDHVFGLNSPSGTTSLRRHSAPPRPRPATIWPPVTLSGVPSGTHAHVPLDLERTRSCERLGSSRRPRLDPDRPALIATPSLPLLGPTPAHRRHPGENRDRGSALLQRTEMPRGRRNYLPDEQSRPRACDAAQSGTHTPPSASPESGARLLERLPPSPPRRTSPLWHESRNISHKLGRAG